MSDRLIPAGCLLAMNLVRLVDGAPPVGMHLVTTSDTDVATAAIGIGRALASHLRAGAPSGQHIVLTVNIFDNAGQSGVAATTLVIGPALDLNVLVGVIVSNAASLVVRAIGEHFASGGSADPVAGRSNAVVH